MATKAYSGQGLVAQIGSTAPVNGVLPAPAAEVFLNIGEPNDIDLPSPTADTIEVTHLQSSIKEFISGLLDGGAATINCNFVNDDPGQLECREAITNKQVRNFRFVFPTTLTPNILDVQALVVGMPQKVGVNDKLGLSINLKVTSVYAWSNG